MDLTPVGVSQWLTTAMSLKTKYIDFQNRLSAVKASSIDATKYPKLAKQREKLIIDGDKLLNRTQSVVNSVDSAYGYMKGLPNTIYQAGESLLTKVSGDASSAIDWVKNATGLNGLGFVGIILAVSVITSSAASLSNWINKSIDFQAQIAKQKQLESAGISPGEAEKIATAKEPGKLKTVAKIGAIGGILLLAYRVID